ncbi:hypothetical protein B0T25DRAFT_154658 [Lasiosphaeria hispida]|uniref:C2H2-type domain-containing protein n=1 Tax=Lasiosphaeria hispida TaxID=260671 RepID=A0AAJ0HLY3_9PEZI|nr:hypothetical protein B0T25DRAFT_154658 [Lasiosphaeria hispida]
MNTTSAPHFTHVSPSELYDPDDDVIPRNSPLMKPTRPVLLPTPSTQFPALFTKVSPPSSPGAKQSNRRMKVRPSQGDGVLVRELDGNRRPEIALLAATEGLPSDMEDEEEYDPSTDTSSSSANGNFSPRSDRSSGGRVRHEEAEVRREESGAQRMELDPPEQDENMGAFDDLKSLAASALAAGNALDVGTTDIQPEVVEVAALAGPTPPVSENDVGKERLAPTPLNQSIAIRRGGPTKDERLAQAAVSSPFSPQSLCSPRDPSATPLVPSMEVASPSNGLTPSSSHSEGLPPIQMISPRSDSNGQMPLPSIRAQLGDIRQLGNNHVAENERLRNPHHVFQHSPPSNMPRLPSIHASPPISPVETYRRGDPLFPPGSFAPVTTPPYPYAQASMHLSPYGDYPSSTTETGSDQSGSTPAASIADKMSIEGLTIHSAVYHCNFAGCNAAPFQTQYLLNSHANVHSSARPHYCPVAGCPRSEGGKGFKRKNEMIRHGLVHDSPGYVCPFCPDREHKYPRPDNLQRHVRVHHVDKDKDDAELRDVLAQRPDGPNRGRRRRGGPGL